MTRPEQKKRELHALDEYLKRRDIKGRVEPGEAPDFTIHCSDGTTGVEVTEYHQPQRNVAGHTRRVVEAAWEAIRSRVVVYRENHPELDNLSVLLRFKTLIVPSTREADAFIQEVVEAITANEKRITDRFLDIRIGADHPGLLRRYLHTVSVRKAGCYMEWDWNHMVGGVGTSEHELLDIVERKLTYAPPPNYRASHLLIVGGVRISETVGAWSADQLNGFTILNEALTSSHFDEVCILCYNSFLWKRGAGWRSL